MCVFEKSLCDLELQGCGGGKSAFYHTVEFTQIFLVLFFSFGLFLRAINEGWFCLLSHVLKQSRITIPKI